MYKRAIVKKGSYTLISDTTFEENVCLVVPAGEYTTRIIYDGKYDSTKEFIQVSDDKLTFHSGCYAFDAGQYSEFERLNYGR